MPKRSNAIMKALAHLHQRPIAFYPCYAVLLESVSAGVLLSQIMYWWSAVGARPFDKTDAELRAETMLNEWEFRKAKAKLKDLPFLSVKRKGVPPTTCYEVDQNLLFETLGKLDSSPIDFETVSELNERQSPNQTRDSLRNIPETTPETTPENKHTKRAREKNLEKGDHEEEDYPPPPVWPPPKVESEIRWKEGVETPVEYIKTRWALESHGWVIEYYDTRTNETIGTLPPVTRQEETERLLDELAGQKSLPPQPACVVTGCDIWDPLAPPCGHEAPALELIQRTWNLSRLPQRRVELHAFVHDRDFTLNDVALLAEHAQKGDLNYRYIGVVFNPERVDQTLANVKEKARRAAHAEDPAPSDRYDRPAAYKPFPPDEPIARRDDQGYADQSLRAIKTILNEQGFIREEPGEENKNENE